MSALATKLFGQNTQNVLIVDAYLRQSQYLLDSNDNKKKIISIDVRNLCLLFYKCSTYIDTELAGNKDLYDECISMDNDIITFHTTSIARRSHAVTCLIGNKITNRMCKKVTVNFKSLIIEDGKIYDYLDYIHIGFRDTRYKIRRYKAFAQKFEGHLLGIRTDQTGVVGFRIEYNKKNYFIICSDQNQRRQRHYRQEYKSENNFKRGDEFTLCIDFENDTYSIYHNGKYAFELPLKGWKEIQFAASLCCVNDKLQVNNWQFWL